MHPITQSKLGQEVKLQSGNDVSREESCRELQIESRTVKFELNLLEST